MATSLILLIYIAALYGLLRLIEFGIVTGWKHLRHRRRRRGDEVIFITGAHDEGTRPPRPKLKREAPGRDRTAPTEASAPEAG